MKWLVFQFGDPVEYLFTRVLIESIRASDVDADIHMLISHTLDRQLNDRIESITHHVIEGGWSERRRLKRDINRLNLDVIINAQRRVFPDADRWMRKLHAARKIGYNFSGKIRPHTHPLDKGERPHLVDHYLKAVDAAGIRAIRNLGFPHSNIAPGDRIVVDVRPAFDGQQWPAAMWRKWVDHHTVRMVPLTIIVDNDEIIKSGPGTDVIKSPDGTTLANQVATARWVVTTANDSFVQAHHWHRPILMLDGFDMQRQREPLIPGSVTVRPRSAGERVADIRFDTVLQAFRDMMVDLV